MLKLSGNNKHIERNQANIKERMCNSARQSKRHAAALTSDLRTVHLLMSESSTRPISLAEIHERFRRRASDIKDSAVNQPDVVSPSMNVAGS